ncbi:hypothetical protein [Algoriphagus machipongonensis]|uniref:Uncharacterized protein n=1 Tax=Algoriphagus machipongonensis TaxID=388413 RepID=A3HTZ8_9BACT|nr:hypothetical protein [Algoriphagus machipongonensis]EAZ81620.1 hypothetical protein ALPR1_00225 [Algoriphagus machipongonensis]
MELKEFFNWISQFICQNPFWSIIGAVFTPTALIQLRKFYLEYFSKIKIEIIKVSILSRSANYNVPRDKVYFSVESTVKKKTRKTIHLERIECRIITDSIKTNWYEDNWAPRKIDLINNRTVSLGCNFLELPNYNIYQFEVRIKEDGTNKYWSKKSKKYILEGSQLIESN